MKLNQTDRQLLQTLKERSRCLLTQAKKDRKYQPASNFSERELATLSALCDLERASAVLLNNTKGNENE